MSYAAGETLIMTNVQQVSGFTGTVLNGPAPTGLNVSRGKYGMLNKGSSDHYAIIRPGASSMRFETYNIEVMQWKTIIAVWQRYKDDGDSLTNLEGLMQGLLTRFQQYRKLTDTTGLVLDSFPSAMADVQEMWMAQDRGPSWLKQEITIDWIEQQTVTFAE